MPLDDTSRPATSLLADLCAGAPARQDQRDGRYDAGAQIWRSSSDNVPPGPPKTKERADGIRR